MLYGRRGKSKDHSSKAALLGWGRVRVKFSTSPPLLDALAWRRWPHFGASRRFSRSPRNRLGVYRTRSENGPREEDAPSVLPSGDHLRLGGLPYYRERASPASRIVSSEAPFLQSSPASQPASLPQSLTGHNYITGPSYTTSLNGHPSFNCRAWSSVNSISPVPSVLKGLPWLGSKLPRHDSTSCQSCHCMIAMDASVV